MTKEEMFLTIKYMKHKKYFKSKNEYFKTRKFANKKNIPEWLLIDIKNYFERMIKENADKRV